ncbi:hypothetical protein [Flavobacterium sp.]|uniref:hypothetical protein n=1 Tax=Flavobacterium sp. TaxID=239 RepID=UPI0039E4F283
MTSQERSLNKLISLKDNLEKIEFENIKELIRETLFEMPLATAILEKNSTIERIRINGNRKFFTTQSELSYISDEEIIKTCLKNYGRANKPFQSLFYGATESSKIQVPRITAYRETSRFFRESNSILLEGELFTRGTWKNKEDLKIVEIVFCEEVFKSNPDILEYYKIQFQQLNEYPEIALKQLQFFSNEFARKIKSNFDYKISAAFTDVVLYENQNSYAGIIYPSVQTNYEGNNIVLKPTIVDQHLELKSVSTHRFHRSSKKQFLVNYFYTEDLGSNKSNFVWDLSQCNEELKIQESINMIQ